jgi:hypothetical protein
MVLGHLKGYFCLNVDGELLAQAVIVGKNLRIRRVRHAHMPPVTIKTGIAGPDGREEELTEYLCDWPGCPNIAAHVLGCVKELGLAVAVCEEHATTRRNSAHD